MKYIEAMEEFKGKTIKSLSIVDCGESLAIIFTDDTCAMFEQNCDDIELSCEDYICNHVKREAGFISETEYELIKSRENEKSEGRKRQADLNELARLKKKYES